MWNYNNTEELYHHGILGQKWGVRRYQNYDGSLISSTKRKKNGSSVSKSLKTKNKSVDEMSENELNNRTRRLRAENNYISAKNQRESYEPVKTNALKSSLKYTWENVVKPAATTAGRNVLEKALEDYGNKLLSKYNSNKEVKKTVTDEIKNISSKKTESKKESKEYKENKKTFNEAKSEVKDAFKEAFREAAEGYKEAKAKYDETRKNNVSEADWYEETVEDKTKARGKQLITTALARRNK